MPLNDAEWMSHCLALAARGRGRTAPNPLVGCAIVKEGELLGEGYHPQAGQPHAEVFALESARAQNHDVRGATLYVNLEPCNHYGRTPPCTEAIIAAGISRVVVGMIDPDPRVSGSGCARLRSAGITVTVGVLAPECQRLNEGFVHRVKYQRPFGIYKYAMTLDGKIATDTGDSFWITGTAARQWVYDLRSSCEAIITGGSTVRRDNPALTTHGVSDHNPLRVVMTQTLDLPLDRKLWQVQDAPTLVFTPLPCPNPVVANALLHMGVEVAELSPCNPLTVLAELAKRGCNTVLWECGGRLAAEAFKAGAIQKIHALIAPKLIGGELSFSPLGSIGKTLMGEAIVLKDTAMTMLGEDWLITGYVQAMAPV